MNINRIAVVGTGLMGKGIVHVFASHNFKVDFFGRRDNVKEELIHYFENEVKKGRLLEENKENMLANICIYNMNDHCGRFAQSDLIIETVKEELETKKRIFQLIDKDIREDTIVASNTSSYSITKMSGFLSNPQNFLGMHFFSPVPLMKLVEVVRGAKTGEKIVNHVSELVKRINKLPVVVEDSPGFVLNRGLFVMIHEAVCMLDENIAKSAEDIDNIFVNGMSMKVGPLRLADMVGIDVTYTILKNLYEGLKNDKYKPCMRLKDMVESGKIGKKSGCGFYNY
ncbi:MAG: 3-hydroxyacyl-CoA dehydrogenase family protein [Clostridia bacterium]|nr:3-hydroxyacyl-CoA dehydrogenase family protein [Clostridia bacterium]